jgi:glutaredoxin
MNAATRKIEVFSAGCGACAAAVNLVKRLATSSCEVVVLDMHQQEVAERAKGLGIERVPAVVVDGRLADCCSVAGPTEAGLRAAGVGAPL